MVDNSELAGGVTGQALVNRSDSKSDNGYVNANYSKIAAVSERTMLWLRYRRQSDSPVLQLTQCSHCFSVGFLTELQALDCHLYMHQQALDTSAPSGKAMFQMCGVFAEFERAMIVERENAGLKRAKAQGVKLGRGNRKDGAWSVIPFQTYFAPIAVMFSQAAFPQNDGTA